MRCVLCHSLSWNLLCHSCLRWIAPTPQTRTIGDLCIYSVFDYHEVDILLKSKYAIIGSRILRLLANKAARFVAQNAKLPRDIYGVAIDDKPKGGYAHTAIIAHAFEHYAGIAALYGRLIAQSNVRYAGKSLDFRRKNPRRFTTTLTQEIAGNGVILYDDIIITGTTLREAATLLKKRGIPVICAITLCSSTRTA